jgi:hypothetical protein
MFKQQECHMQRPVAGDLFHKSDKCEDKVFTMRAEVWESHGM